VDNWGNWLAAVVDLLLQAQSFFVYPVQATKIATVSDMTDIASIEYFSRAAFDTTAVVRKRGCPEGAVVAVAQWVLFAFKLIKVLFV
jgi:NADH:ubiquinone oxidoreductase subunit E